MPPETVTIYNAVSLLFEHDRSYCDNLFNRYRNLSDILFKMYMASTLELVIVKEKDDEIFIEGLNAVQKALDNIPLDRNELTKKMILNIEEYFLKRYEYTFTSILAMPGFECPNMMPGYDVVVFNMMHQLGMRYFGPDFSDM